MKNGKDWLCYSVRSVEAAISPLFLASSQALSLLCSPSFNPPGHFLYLQPSRDAHPAAPGEQPSPDSPTSPVNVWLGR